MSTAALPPLKPYLEAGERFAGAFDYLDPSAGLRGWALDVPNPGRPVALEVRCEGQTVALCEAVMDRPDLDAPAGRPTYCGFLIGWSRFDVALLTRLAAEAPAAEVTLHVALNGALVPNLVDRLNAADVLDFIQRSPRGDRAPHFGEVNAYHDILASGLFDAEWYVSRYGADIAPSLPPLLHYLRVGEARDARPNLLFDPGHYAVLADLPNPRGALLDFLRTANVSGIEPSVHFDPTWFRRSHGDLRGAKALGHYLAHRHQLSPNVWFDRAGYAAGSGLPPDSDLYAHFVLVGAWTGLTRFASQRAIPEPVLEDIEALHRGETSPADLPAAPPRPAPPKPPAAPPPPPAPPPAPAAIPLARPPAAPPAPAAIPLAKPPAAPPPAIAIPLAKPPAEPPVAPAPPPPPRLPSLAEMERLGVAGLSDWVRSLPPGARPAIRAEASALLSDSGGAILPQLVQYLLGGEGDGGLADPALAGGLLERGRELPEAARTELASRIALETHRAFEAGARAEAEKVYAALHEQGLHDQLTLLRLMEQALARGELPRARLLGRELEQRYEGQLTPWSIFALSRLHEALSQPARAVAALRNLPGFPAIPANAEAVAVFRLLELGAVEAAQARLDEAENLPVEEGLAPRFRVAVHKGEIAELRRFIEPRRAEKLPDWLLTEAIFRLSADGRIVSREGQRVLRGLYAALEGRGLSNGGVVQARLHCLLITRQFEAMGALLAEVEATPFGALRETRLRRLEYLCNVGDLEAAGALYQETFKDDALNKWEGLVILRLLSDQKNWREAGEVLLKHIGNGHDFGPALHAAMRVVRRARLHETVLEVEARVGDGASEELKAFFALVHEDQGLLESGDASRQQRPRSSYRSNWLVHAPEGETPSEEYCLFLCTNERYFLSLLTFLCSFAGQSPQVNARIFVFLDNDVPRAWTAAVKALSEHFRRDITIVEEAAFMPRGVEHQVEYGFFAGGSNLSRAAYFRIYAARYLLDNFSFRRAAYVDTDIICRGDLTPLFTLDANNALLFAATEEISPHVVSAATRNGLDPWRYFNSGVLALRFDQPALREHIEEAIRISEQEPERLVFHDQCALNIAFKDVKGELPPRLNHFLRPSRDRNGYIEDGLLLHFLDKPKPWDITFDRPYREEWRVWAVLLGLIVPRGLYAKIFAAANQD